MKHDDRIIFYAFRYALGRRSYAVADVVGYVLFHWDELQGKTKELMKKEIKTALDENRAGMDMDERQWRRVLDR